MDVFAKQDDGREQLLASGLDAKEILEMQEQWRYTKPFGSSIKIIFRGDYQPIFGFSTTGTDTAVAADARHSEIFIG